MGQIMDTHMAIRSGQICREGSQLPAHDKRNQKIIKLRSENLTFSQIGQRLGVSRNTVCGVLSRAGLLGKRIYVPKTTVARRTVPKAPPRPRPEPFAPESLVEPMALGERAGGCQWLHGEAFMRNFCGHVKKPNSPFCIHHHRRCFTYAPVKFTSFRYR